MLKRQRLNKVSLFLTESDLNSICWNKGWLRSHLITLVWLQFKQINNCDKGDDTTLVWDTIVYLDKKLFNLHRYRCASDIYQSYLDVFRCDEIRFDKDVCSNYMTCLSVQCVFL